MNKLIQNINQWMMASFNQHRTIFWARRLIYGWLLVQMLLLLPVSETYWGVNAIVPTSPWQSWSVSGLLNLFQLQIFQEYHSWVIVLYLIVLGLGIMGKWPRLMAILIFILASSFISRMAFIITGGEMLLRLLLFYLLFADEKSKSTDGVWDHVRNRSSLLACQINIVFLYIFAGWYKIEDPLWINGEALYWIAQIDTFSGETMRSMMEIPWLYKIATWSALGYQLLFPILVWVKKVKIPFLLIGVVFHLFIAIGMGLFSFGIIMIISYRFFISSDDRLILKKNISTTRCAL